MRVLCLLVCLLVARWALRPAAAFAAEARLRTLGGEQVDGVIRWESNGVVVIDPKLSRIRHVPFSTILRFESEPSEDPSTTTPPATSEPEMMNELPFPWESGVIGAPGELGRASWRDGVFRIETQDAQLGGVKESGRLIFEPIRGDREILVRMNPLRSTQDEARSGICFRSSVDAASPGVFWGSTGSREDVFEWRSASGALMVKSAFDPIPGHRWFKLKRQGDTFSAFRSRDGLRWLLACRTNVPLSRDALVGLVAATPSTSRPMVSTFEHARHAQRMRGAYGVRVELVSGSTLECAELEYDGEALRFFGLEARPRVPLDQVSRIVFQPIPSRSERRLQIGQPGAMLTTGDFVEGTPRTLLEGLLTLDSVLFGRTRVDVVNEVVAIVFRPMRVADTRYRVGLRDGSMFLSRTVALEGHSLKLSESALGDCLVPLAELVSVERSAE